MRYFITPLFVGFCIAISLDTAAASPPIKLGLVYIQGVLETEADDAPYNQLLNALESELGARFETSFLPTARTHKMLAERALDCSFPDNLSQVANPAGYIQSAVVSSVSAYLFTLKQRPYQSLEAVAKTERRLLVYLAGYSFADLFAEHPQLFFVPIATPQRAVTLLEKNRVEGFVDYLPDLTFALNSEQMGKLQYNPNRPLRKLEDRFLCLDNPQNRAWLARVDAQLLVWRQSGHLARLLGRFYVADLGAE